MLANVVVGYDGSPGASAAINVGAVLVPGARALVACVWVPPFASDEVRRRLRAQARNLDELIEMVDREGEREAERVAATGATLARAAGWDAEPLVQRTWGAEGLAIAKAAEQADADLVLVGSRGLGGTQAILGSVSDMVVHYCSRPVLVVHHPMLAGEYDDLTDGPVVVGWDGSQGAASALAAAAQLFPQREVVAVSVDDGSSPQSEDSPNIDGTEINRVNVERTDGVFHRGVARALVDAASQRGAALVVVGSRGRSAAREILLGSVAVGTLHNCHRPVMVVPGEWRAASSL